MSRVLHIVAKDARAIVVPLAAWLLLLALQTIAFALYRGVPSDASSLSPGQLFEFLSAHAEIEKQFEWVVQGMDVCLAALLVFRVVNEDAVTGTQAFWRTRPIAADRLLIAKLLGVTLFFLVAPALVLAAVWAALGFSVAAIVLVAHSLWVPIVATVVIAFGLAAMCRQPAAFVFAAAAWFLAFLICQLIDRRADDFREIRVVMLVAWLAAPALLARLQFARPTSRTTWLTLAAGLIVMIAVDWQRPGWAVALGEAWLPAPIARGGQASADREVAPRIGSFDAASGILSVRSAPATDGGRIAVVTGAVTQSRGTHGHAQRWWGIAPDWGQAAAVDVLRAREATTGDWRLNVAQSEIFDPTQLQSVEWVIGWMRPRIAWKVVLEAGATVRERGEAAEIVALRIGSGGGSCFVRERCPAAEPVNRSNNARIDVYVLVASRGREFIPTEVHEVEPLLLNGVAIVARELRFRLPDDGRGATDVAGATLAKVEFTCERAFTTLPQ